MVRLKRMVNYNNLMKFKNCPKCGQRNFIRSKECVKCGHVFELSKKFDYVEFENNAVSAFNNNGWAAKMPNQSKKVQFDIELYYKEELYGYVELIFNPSKQKLLDILNRSKDFISNNNYKIFVITDLTTFYVSYFKKGFEKTYIMPTPYSYPFLVQTINSFVEELNKDESK